MMRILIAFSFSIVLFSCKKDYTCECITTDSDGEQSAPITFVIHNVKNEAEKKCENQVTLEDLFPDTESTTVCQLK